VSVMNKPTPWSGFDALVTGLAALQRQARQEAARSVDEILTVRSWLIGAWIIAYEQHGADRARYGDRLIDSLAEEFRSRNVTGLSASNLRNCRQIALAWPRLVIHQTLSVESVPSLPTPAGDALSWRDDGWMTRLRTELSLSHLLELSRIDNPVARSFYELQALTQRWNVRELRRQRDSMLYERVGLSKDRDAVLALAGQGRSLDTPAATIRDPYVLEFLGLEGRRPSTEAALEAALIGHLEAFLLELGVDFCFMGRQYRITVGGRHHFIDLLFFHRRLRCLVAVDLKLGTFGHEDAGQMNFYLNFLAEKVALPGENAPIGIVLCAEKDAAEVHYATGGLDRQVFVSRYLVALPTEDQLRAWLAEEREVLARAHVEGTVAAAEIRHMAGAESDPESSDGR
jgi:predicted nuclease of restriction endonuclease-like (RecB) superfamily